MDRVHSLIGIYETEVTVLKPPSIISPSPQRGGHSEGGGGVNEVCLARAVAFRKQTAQLLDERGTLATL